MTHSTVSANTDTTLPSCGAFGWRDDSLTYSRVRPFYGIKSISELLQHVNATGGDGVEIVESEYGVCGEQTYREEIDRRFGVPLCRTCFFELAKQWRAANQDEGLCACGRDPLPGIKTCRDCNARDRRQAAAQRNRERAVQKVAGERAEAERIDKEQRKLRDSLTLAELEDAIEQHGGDRRAAALSLGIVDSRPKHLEASPPSAQNLLGRRLGALRRKAATSA